jgi:predicted O-methyltransferase YrrM
VKVQTIIDIGPAYAIGGWMHAQELTWLAQMAASCRTIVEFGCYKGRSTRALADHCAGTVYAVDPWDGGYRNDDDSQATWLDTRNARQEFEKNLADHLASGRVVQLKVTSAEAAPVLAGLGADLIFIDGDHRREAVLEDIGIARQAVRRGGIIAGHDYSHHSWPGVKQAVDAEFPARAVRFCRSIWWVTT